MKSEKNVGNLESAVRWAAGAAILAAGLSKRRWWAVLGVIPLYTAATKYCPVNKRLGINTDDSAMSLPYPTAVAADHSAENPVSVAAEPHPYYDPSHQRHQDAYIPKSHMTDHRTHVGNGPGERNQIGGRASGKKARY